MDFMVKGNMIEMSSLGFMWMTFSLLEIERIASRK